MKLAHPLRHHFRYLNHVASLGYGICDVEVCASASSTNQRTGESRPLTGAICGGHLPVTLPGSSTARVGAYPSQAEM